MEQCAFSNNATLALQARHVKIDYLEVYMSSELTIL